ncbi:uncharacterized protein RSE6_10213 [Rhynchosporium secalis]|uniref:ceramidase n=1 Tax=Rhynchosporium secalis TaxID=38038 RepID=A0A1E1MJY7_RHYSE|nr:uncharacterized protein RSE6_10213 [Rhynchosporium secalis]
MVMPESRQKDGPIPTYQIDLSLPPAECYVQLATDFAPEIKSARKLVEWLASIFLYRVYSAEETKELKGISEASGVDLYFLVALNVLLDSLLGCTSGGVMTSMGQKGGDGKRMMHFRTLDWGMDPLRSVLVVLEFVRSESDNPKRIVGRSITYAGFVGILTGVRKDLSVSLNFRPTYSYSTFSLRKHQLLVLLAFRPSVCSIMRSMIVPSDDAQQTNATSLAGHLTTSPKLRCPPCYLVLSDGLRAAVIERDLDSAEVRIDSEFIIVTNNDTMSKYSDTKSKVKNEKEKSTLGLDIDDWIQESSERMECVWRKWCSVKKRVQKKLLNEGATSEDLVHGGWASVKFETLKGWLRADPVNNEGTHFLCIMDPQNGEIRFMERGIGTSDVME